MHPKCETGHMHSCNKYICVHLSTAEHLFIYFILFYFLCVFANLIFFICSVTSNKFINQSIDEIFDNFHCNFVSIGTVKYSVKCLVYSETRRVFQRKTDVPPHIHSHPYFPASSVFPPICFIVQIFSLLIYSFKFDLYKHEY